jgi:hypothetical protein
MGLHLIPPGVIPRKGRIPAAAQIAQLRIQRVTTNSRSHSPALSPCHALFGILSYQRMLVGESENASIAAKGAQVSHSFCAVPAARATREANLLEALRRDLAKDRILSADVVGSAMKGSYVLATNALTAEEWRGIISSSWFSLHRCSRIPVRYNTSPKSRECSSWSMAGDCCYETWFLCVNLPAYHIATEDLK